MPRAMGAAADAGVPPAQGGEGLGVELRAAVLVCVLRWLAAAGRAHTCSGRRPPPTWWVQEAWLFDWADLPPPQFALRLGGVWAAFLVALGLPVSVLTFDLSRQPLECLVAASTGSLFLVGVLVLRLYLVSQEWRCGSALALP